MHIDFTLPFMTQSNEIFAQGAYNGWRYVDVLDNFILNICNRILVFVAGI